MAWIDSASRISIFTIGELKRMLGKAEVKLLPLMPNDDEFRNYGKEIR